MQNIFNSLTKLHTPEWLKVVNPEGLIDKLMSCLKFLIPTVARYRQQPFRYSKSIQRKGYMILKFTSKDIFDTTGKRLLHSRDQEQPTFNQSFPFRVKTLQECDILGCGYTKHSAIKNIDYIYKNGCYWFRENPTKFCYSYKENGKLIYYTIAFGSNYTKLAKSYAPVSDIESTPLNTQMYDNMISNGLQGISNSFYLNKAGIFTSDGLHGKVETIWEEKDYKFIVTDTGNFIAIPNKLNIHIAYNEPIMLNYNNFSVEVL